MPKKERVATIEDWGKVAGKTCGGCKKSADNLTPKIDTEGRLYYEGRTGYVTRNCSVGGVAVNASSCIAPLEQEDRE